MDKYTSIGIKQIKIIVLSVMIVFCLILSPIVQSFAAQNASVASEIKSPYFLEASRVSDNALNLRWTKVDAVSGYQVFKYNSKAKKYQRVKTLKGASKIQWADKKLTPNKKYAYKVRTYKKLATGTIYSPFTYIVSAIANKNSSKKVNAGDIQSIQTVQIDYEKTKTVKNAKVIKIGIGETRKITGRVLPSKADVRKGKKVLSSKARLMVTKSGNVVQDNKGRLVGKLPGYANVYLMAHNGFKKKLNVQVIDYAKPEKWRNLDELDSYPRKFVVDYKTQMNEIASYFSKNQAMPHGIVFGQSSDGNLAITDYSSRGALTEKNRPDLAAVLKPIKEVVIDSPYILGIVVTQIGDVVFNVMYPGSNNYYYEISFGVEFDCPEDVLNNADITKLAPHWEYRKKVLINI